MITREQVADLRPGDVVEFRCDEWHPDVWLRGPLATNEVGCLVLPHQDGTAYWIRTDRGHAFDGEHRTLTVISRAPRPLYVNHDRTEPVPGDVVGGDGLTDTWAYFGPEGGWALTRTCGYADRRTMPDRLRLLVDGETGQVVP